MIIIPNPAPSWSASPQQAMLDRGLLPDFSPEVLRELAAIQAPADAPRPRPRFEKHAVGLDR